MKKICKRVISGFLVLVLMMSITMVTFPMKAEAKNFNGNWKATKKDAFGRLAIGTIKNGVIKIYWSESGSKSLYWYGWYSSSYKSGTYTLTSYNDHDKTDSAFFASGDETKIFTYKNGYLSFKSSMMGVTSTIYMKQTSVTPIPPKPIKINHKKLTLQQGKTKQLKLSNVPNGVKIKWKSSKKSVATVSFKGLVKAKKNGKTTITATVKGKHYTCKVTVPLSKKQKRLAKIKKLKTYLLKQDDSLVSYMYDSDELDASCESFLAYYKGNGFPYMMMSYTVETDDEDVGHPKYAAGLVFNSDFTRVQFVAAEFEDNTSTIEKSYYTSSMTIKQAAKYTDAIFNRIDNGYSGKGKIPFYQGIDGANGEEAIYSWTYDVLVYETICNVEDELLPGSMDFSDLGISRLR